MERIDDGKQDEVVERVFVAVGLGGLVVDELAQIGEGRGIGLKVEVKMWNGLFGNEQARSNDFSQGAELADFIAFVDDRAECLRHRRRCKLGLDRRDRSGEDLGFDGGGESGSGSGFG